MRDILGEGLPEVALPERHEAIQTFLFDRSHKALGVRIGIRGAVGRLHDSKPCICELVPDGATPLRIPITDEHLMTSERAVVGKDQRAGDLVHEQGIGMTCGVEHLDPP
jgi:hypothetical protein